MSEPITNVGDAVAALGALPVPQGSELQPVDVVDQREQAVAWEGHVLGAWDGEFAMETGLDRAVLKLARMVKADVSEIERLRAQVAGLLAERHSTNEALDEAARALREQRDRIAEHDAQREALVERLRAGQRWERGRNPELVSENLVSQSELRSIFGIPLAPPWENEPAPKCRCSEPDADPYACEADDCEGEFSELNPFGGGPVEGVDAKVSKVCGCGWRTSVWHVNDGSAEEELHGHVVRAHGGVYPTKAGAS